jgi:hypothetical protein
MKTEIYDDAGRPVKNLYALANPQALDCFKDLPELQV